MKTYEDVMAEVQKQDALREKFVSAFDQEKLVAFFKEAGVDATEEGVKDFLYSHSFYQSDAEELSDEELEQISGGAQKKKKCRVCKEFPPLKICITLC